jgi:N-acetyl-anhydromuramyl-L-alanine amidase AmpD
VPPYSVRPDIVGRSDLAIANVDRQRDVDDRSIPVFGVAVHCTGSGIVTKALARGADPFEYALAYYLRPDSYFAHYVIDFDGTIAQIADEHERAPHIGLPSADRDAYLSGRWKKQLPTTFVSAWAKRWPKRVSPSHLYPGASPNNAYVGMELLVWQAGCSGAPRAPGRKYTTAQHDAAAELAVDIARRWELPAGWPDTGRLACHEDITPLKRTSKGAGWDPGVIRAAAWFDWEYFKDAVIG